jgi:2-methylcitrate dehydratase PrpD
MTPTLVEQLAALAAKTTYDTLPAEIREGLPSRVLDVVGLCLAALPLDTSDAVLAHVAAQGGAAQATAIGLTECVPAAQAAFVNGVLAHSLDYDDTHLPSVLHPSASIVPASLAAGELTGASGADVLAAMTIGTEVCVRLGMAGYDAEAGQSTYFERGQHATSICGAIGGAAAAARLLGLPAAGIADAMALAVSMSGGVLEANRTGGTVKRLHCGWAAHAALTAAELAARGFTGPPTVLEGRFGFFEAYLSGQYDATAVTAGLGDTWAIADVHYKPYPANHFLHAVIDAVLALRAGGLTADDVTEVVVGVPTPTVRTVGEPIAGKRRPTSGYHAKFSAPYIVAAALCGGSGLGVGLRDFDDVLVTDSRRRALMDLVTVVADAGCDEAYPAQLPAVVTVRTRDGHTRTERVMTNRGGPQRPLSTAQLGRKFADNAAESMDADDASALDSAIRDIARRDNVRGLLPVLRREGR